MEKEKVSLKGVNETLFVPLYARALESQKKNPLFYDETAIRILHRLDYDFEKHGGSKMNMWGCAARTKLFDDQVSAYIEKYPDCSVINLACGMDDRFSRVDNGKIRWYNVDFPDVIRLRRELIPGSIRVTDIGGSAFDYSWMDQVENKDHALMICEGFLMYVTEEETRSLFTEAARRFTNTTLLLELMTRWMVDHQKFHDTTKKTDVTFQWGVKQSADFCQLCPQFKMVGEYNFTDGMKHFSPVWMTLAAPILRPKNNRLAVYTQTAKK